MIQPLSDKHIPTLHALYNTIIKPLSYEFRATREEFGAAIGVTPGTHANTSTFVAMQAGGPVGFIRASILGPKRERITFAREGQGIIYGPFVRPKYVDMGAQLLDTALEYVQELGADAAIAFDPVEGAAFPFYVGGWTGLSERLPHIARVVTSAGFYIRHRELCLQLDHQDMALVNEPERPLTITTERRERSRYQIHLWHEKTFIGVCKYSRMYPAHNAHRNAVRQGYIDGLSVEEMHRGRGYGRVLITRALSDLNNLGCTGVRLTTAADNFRAQNLYYSLGFRVIDSCITLEMRLSSKQ